MRSARSCTSLTPAPPAAGRPGSPAARSHSCHRRHHRHPHVPLPFRPEERARRHDHAAAFQQRRPPSRAMVRPPGTFDPQVEGGLAARDLARPVGRTARGRPAASRRSARRFSSTWASSFHAATLARWTNSCGVTPTLGRSALSAAIRSGSPGREPAAVPGHRRALRQRVERQHVRRGPRPGARCGRASSNQSSLYASSEASSTSCARRALGRLAQERQRRDGAGGVVRVVQPQDRGALPRGVVDRRRGRAGTPALSRSGRRSTSPPANRAPRSGIVYPGAVTTTRSLPPPGPARPAPGRTRAPSEPSVGRICRVGIHRRPRTGAAPSRRSPRAAPAVPPPAGTRRSARRPSRSASRMNGAVTSRGSPDAEVDQLTPGGEGLGLAAVELLERVRLHRADPRRQMGHHALPPRVAAGRSASRPRNRAAPRRADQRARVDPLVVRDERTAGRPARSSPRPRRSWRTPRRASTPASGPPSSAPARAQPVHQGVPRRSPGPGGALPDDLDLTRGPAPAAPGGGLGLLGRVRRARSGSSRAPPRGRGPRWRRPRRRSSSRSPPRGT